MVVLANVLSMKLVSSGSKIVLLVVIRWTVAVRLVDATLPAMQFWVFR